MFSHPSQTLWAIDRPFNRRDFTFFEQSSRSRDLTKSTLQAVCLQAVQWAHRMGAIQVPTPSFGEIVLTLFDSFDAEPDEDSSLRILASVMASTSIDGRACIGDALREILRQRSPLVQRVRREASLPSVRRVFRSTSFSLRPCQFVSRWPRCSRRHSPTALPSRVVPTSSQSACRGWR